MMRIEAVWATTAAREMFSDSERQGCVEDYAEHGPQYVAAGCEGFAFYKFTDGRELALVDNHGKVSIMTQKELREAQRRR